jgi:DNA-binding LytR/AlgR family response regulator
MTKLKCIIVDDEPMALKLIEKYVSQTPDLELVGKFENAFEAEKAIQSTPVDLLFLDIQMPDMDGIEFAAKLPPQVRVIFTTAFQEYALESYKVNALDYLLKPFNYTEFLKATEKAKNWFQLVNISAKTENEEAYMLVKSGYKSMQIKLNEILYIQGLKDYVKIYIEELSSPILTLMTMKNLETDLPQDKFMRVHRSFIVALDKIRSIEKGMIKIKDKIIPISDSYRATFQEYVNNNNFKIK